MKLLKLILNSLPRSAKYKFARKIGSILFLLRRLVGFHYFDKYLLWLYLKVNDLEKAEKIISDHKNDLNYCRYVLDVERRKSFGKEAEIRRLDYKEEDSIEYKDDQNKSEGYSIVKGNKESVVDQEVFFGRPTKKILTNLSVQPNSFNGNRLVLNTFCNKVLI